MREGITANKKKRFAFVGNMNNMPFLYAREIKKRGEDVFLFIDAPPDFKLDRPESCDPSITLPYPDWIEEIPGPRISHFIRRLFPKLFYRKFIQRLKSFDVVVFNGNWFALAPFLDSKTRVFALCAGYEIDILCDLRGVTAFADTIVEKVTWLRHFKFILIRVLARRIRLHRRGVNRSDGICYYPTGISEPGDKLIDEVMGQKRYSRLELRGFSTSEYQYVKPVPDKEKFTILNFTRFFFMNDQLDNKRNDIMLEGVGSFIQGIEHKDDVEILFYNKGDDSSLRKAKEMIDDLGYSANVAWHDEISQGALFKDVVPRCDVAFDQLGNQWIGAGLYAMLIGRPIIANGRPEIFDHLLGEGSPVCQATTADQVCYWLRRLYVDRNEVEQIGLRSREYVEKFYDIKKTIDFFISEGT